MDPATLVGGITALLSTAGTAAQTATNATANRRAYKWGKKYFERVTYPQWQRQEELNSARAELAYQRSTPAHLMGLARMAGLNPNAAGLQALGSTGYSAPAASSANIPTPNDQNSYGSLSDIGPAAQRGIAAILSLKQQEKNLVISDANIRKIEAEADKAEQDAIIASQLASGGYGTHRAASVAQSVGVAITRIEEMRSNIQVRNLTARKIVSEISLLNSRVHVNEAVIAKTLSDIDINAVRQSLMRSQIAVNSGRLTLQEAQEQAIYAGISDTNAREELTRLNTLILSGTGSTSSSGGIFGVIARQLMVPLGLTD